MANQSVRVNQDKELLNYQNTWKNAPRQDEKPDYIFICGVSRSGTTLLRRVLSKSAEIAISPESFFLGHQLPWEGVRHYLRQVGDLSQDENVYKMVDMLYAGRFKRGTQGYYGWLQKRTDKEVFLEKMLSTTDRSERGVFAIMMEMRGDWKKQKDINSLDSLILGEKTPSHLYYVPTLLEWFPRSKIVHIIRDPRGVFNSEFRRRNVDTRSLWPKLKRLGLLKIYILIQVTYTWLRAAKLHSKYTELNPDKYYLIRFEDLVTEPAITIKNLCEFLSVDFYGSMLEVRVWSRGFNEGKDGFDKLAVQRWREENPPWINSWFLFWCEKYLKSLSFLD